ncbi:MAG: SRPBCC family protein [Kofleriaceae bacterium]
MTAIPNLAPSEDEISVTRAFAVPRALVFEAYTNPAVLKRWLLGPPGWELVVCDVDLKIGGSYQWSWRNREGFTMGMRGHYRDIVPNERLVATETFDDPWAPAEALVTIELDEHDGETTVSTTLRYDASEVRDAALRSELQNGMTAGLDRLASVLV